MEKSLSPAPVVDQEPAILPRGNSSSQNDLYGRPEFGLRWDNDVKHHISRHVLHLRRHRELSQTTLAAAMGTSQSAIARIEAGEENITLATLERLIAALKGRFFVSIQPEEFPFTRSAPWWAPVETSTNKWNVDFVAIHREGNHAIIGIEREVTTNPSGVLTFVATT